jgi:hypothetical protein
MFPGDLTGLFSEAYGFARPSRHAFLHRLSALPENAQQMRNRSSPVACRFMPQGRRDAVNNKLLSAGIFH